MPVYVLWSKCRCKKRLCKVVWSCVWNVYGIIVCVCVYVFEGRRDVYVCMCVCVCVRVVVCVLI